MSLKTNIVALIISIIKTLCGLEICKNTTVARGGNFNKKKRERDNSTHKESKK